MVVFSRFVKALWRLVPVLLLSAGVALAMPLAAARAETVAFKQGLAAESAADEALSAFYRARDHAPIWTGADDAPRRAAFVAALSEAPLHGLATPRYDLETLIADFEAVRSERDRGALEARVSRMFLSYARDVSRGVLTPSRVEPGLVRTIERRDPLELLTAFAAADPAAFLRTLPPQTPEYARLMRERQRLAGRIAAGGWGPEVPAGKYEPGDTGQGVVALRNRLIAMGYLPRRATAHFDGALQAAVVAFQVDHGLQSDGVAGPSTIAALNVPAEERLKSVVVAMERERWMNFGRGDRHIWVNLTDFSSQIVDDGKVTFRTRSVIGKNTGDRRSPEFSDVMTHMVINPSWYVPRSITTGEYLPLLRNNPRAVGHIDVVDSRGRIVNRDTVDFSQFSSRSFPFSMRQRPGAANALGKVKFMFPNQWNIYLHDTPQKALFSREVRDFSHGCIRLNDPFDFAYELLSLQEPEPEAFFHGILDTGRETRVNLEEPVQVHIVYRTAFVPARGRANFRADVYGRDGRIFDALQAAGVALPLPQS